jgi:hypothetical protein
MGENTAAPPAHPAQTQEAACPQEPKDRVEHAGGDPGRDASQQHLAPKTLLSHVGLRSPLRSRPLCFTLACFPSAHS